MQFKERSILLVCFLYSLSYILFLIILLKKSIKCIARNWCIITSKIRYEKNIKENIDKDIKKRILIFLSGERISINPLE